MFGQKPNTTDFFCFVVFGFYNINRNYWKTKRCEKKRNRNKQKTTITSQNQNHDRIENKIKRMAESKTKLNEATEYKV
jgi:hypothetical protein